MKLKTRLFIISILILLASAHVIISGSAHNVPKVGLAYDPMNNSLQIIHINPPPERTMDMGSGIGSDVSPIWPYHLALVSTGFLLVLSAALTARFMKRRKGWLSIHRSLGIFGVVLILNRFNEGASCLSRTDHCFDGSIYALPGIPSDQKEGQQASCPA